MSHYSLRKQKLSAVNVITLAVILGIVIQVLGAILTAYLVGKGSMSENVMDAITVVVQAVGFLLASSVGVLFSSDKKIPNVLMILLIIVLIPVIVSLLLWGIDISAVIRTVITAAVVIGCDLLVLSRLKNMSVGFKAKKRYR